MTSVTFCHDLLQIYLLYFDGSLQRFAQFFVEPLFTASATEREVNAVNSENDKNLQNDTWRLNQLEKSTSKAGHPYTKFGTGEFPCDLQLGALRLLIWYYKAENGTR